jgi:hypothetical protein
MCTKSVIIMAHSFHFMRLFRNAPESAADIGNKLRTRQPRQCSILGRSERFFVSSKTSRLVLLPTKLLINLVRSEGEGGAFPRNKAYHLPPSSAEVMSRWSSTSTPHRPSWRAKAPYFYLETVLILIT